MFFTYILKSKKDSSYYIGSCDDLDKRVCKHNDGMSKYTKGKMPWRLVYFEVFASRNAASGREKEIKKMKSRKYIEELIHCWFEKNCEE